MSDRSVIRVLRSRSIWVDHADHKGTFADVDRLSRCTEGEHWRVRGVYENKFNYGAIDDEESSAYRSSKVVHLRGPKEWWIEEPSSLIGANLIGATLIWAGLIWTSLIWADLIVADQGKRRQGLPSV